MSEQTTKEEKSPKDKINELRIKYRNADLICKIASALSVVAILVYIGVLFYNKTFFTSSPWKIVVSVILLVFMFGSMYILPIILKNNAKRREYSSAYKTYFLKPALEDAFAGGEYNTEEKISVKDLSEMSVLKKAHKAVANDCVRGTYKGVSFLRYDITLQFEKKSAVTDCIMIVCDSDLKVKTEISLVSYKFKIGGKEYEQPEDFCRILSSLQEFNKKYSVYAKDQAKAEDFLEEKIYKKFLKHFFSSPVAAFFDRDKAILVIKTSKDVLEAPVYSSINESKCKKETEQQIEIIKNWIEFIDEI